MTVSDYQAYQAMVASNVCQSCGKQAQIKTGNQSFYCWDCDAARCQAARIVFAQFPTTLRHAFMREGITSLAELRERARSGARGLSMSNVSKVRAKEILRILGTIGAEPHCITCQCWKSDA